MSDAPHLINRKLRRATETGQQAYVYHADSQNPPAKTTHITRTITVRPLGTSARSAS